MFLLQLKSKVRSLGMYALVAVLAFSTGSFSIAQAAAPGTVVAWGTNNFGVTNVPAGIKDVIALAAGFYHALALQSNTTVVAWGDNRFGQTNVPAGLSDVVAISAGAHHSLALKSDGTVVAWGCENGTDHGQCSVPVGLNGVIAVSTGGSHNLALRSDGTVVAWGLNDFGQTNVTPELADVIAVSASFWHNLALKSDGTVVAWGCENGADDGQCSVPVGLNGVIAISAGPVHSLALRDDGTVVAWGCEGVSESGQCNVPVGLNDVTAINAGYSHSLALKSDGTVVAWGCAAAVVFGQCNIPTGLNNVSAIAAGSVFSLAIASDTTPPAITLNDVGTLGNNGWYVGDVAVSWNVVDDESAISSQTGCGGMTLNTDSTGTTLTCSATSAGGTANQSITIKRDATTPSALCGTADGFWHASDVSIACVASDNTSGLADTADANFSLTTTVANGTENSNASTNSHNVADLAGNISMAGPISGNMVDKKAPSISLTSPTATTYMLNQVVAAGYTCADSGSGLASCIGTVANGNNIDTASVGTKMFIVNAADNVGNSISQSMNYTVVYNFSGFFQPVDNLPTLNVIKAGSAIPVKFSLGGNQGLNILLTGFPRSQQIVCNSGLPQDDIEQTVTSGGSSLSYDATTDTYTYVWKTDKTWAGTCRQLVVRLNDGVDHIVNFMFK